ncbi:MAG: amidohydrolase family protein, partial [Actinomycetota bacterium]|nr:amidohydrolase family protein [Actinomycetota bacterium]
MTLLRNARLLDGALVDVLVEAGRIARWSSSSRPRAVAGDLDRLDHRRLDHRRPDHRRLDHRDEEVDLDGRWLQPGLWDSHVHFGQWTLLSRRLDLTPARSAAETVSLVSEHLAQHPPAVGSVVIGQGFRDGLWPDAPTPELLEFGDVPVALVSGDVHCMWTNAAALRLLGLPPEAW